MTLHPEILDFISLNDWERTLPPQSASIVYNQIFGIQHRPLGWWERKLQREGVDPQASFVARFRPRTQDEGVHGPSETIGLVLIYTSRPHVKIVSFGVCPTFQGRGYGRQMMSQAITQARVSGAKGLETTTEPAAQGFYRSLGFEVEKQFSTLMHISCGSGESAVLELNHLAGPWHIPDIHELGRCHDVCAWSKMAWSAPSTRHKQTIIAEIGQNIFCAHLSKEGRAYLVHRLSFAQKSPPTSDINVLSDTDVIAVSQRLLGLLPKSSPVLLHGCPKNLTQPLIERGWVNAQSYSNMLLRFDHAVN